MSSASSLSSWHPAFMPHTIDKNKPTPSELGVQAARPEDAAHIVDSDLEGMDGAVNTTMLEGVKHADTLFTEESDSLDRKAIQPPPEATELLDDSVNSEDSSEEHAYVPVSVESNVRENQDEGEDTGRTIRQGTISGIHTTEQSPQSRGHDRPQSFARSAQAINWGEDDEVDPEWNLRRTDTDPFKLMAASDRTNSFPAVPPVHVPENSQEHELAHSQAEDIISQVEDASKDLFDGEEDLEDEFFTQRSSTISHILQPPQEPEEPAWNSVFKGANAELPVEDRYEEGVPLIGDSEAPHSQADAPAPTGSVVFAETTTEDDDFFSGIGATKDKSHQPSLARKSTMQVMNSLHLQADDELLDDELDSRPATIENSSARNNLIGGGIAVSTSTVLSQVLGKSDLPSAQAGTADGDTLEEDLAARWKAALDGDDFLDDDALLDDDTALLEDEIADRLDPSTLFGSDDDGFLDDEDNHEDLGTDSANLSPQIPAPIHGTNGQVVGFDRLGKAVHTGTEQSKSRYLPSSAVFNKPSPPSTTNAYTPSAPLFTNLVPQGPGSNDAPNASYSVSHSVSPTNSFFPQQPPKPELNKAASFVNQAKGGYTSPYDLPMDVVRTKRPLKKASMQQMGQSYSGSQQAPLAAPPRSVSMYSQGHPQSISAPVTSPLSSAGSVLPHQSLRTGAAVPPTLHSKDSFFEELPAINRAKPAGRYTPQPQASYQGQTLPVDASGYHSQQPHSQAASPAFSQPQGLVAPPPVSPYASLGEPTPQAHVVPSRYSPAPPQPTVTNGPTGASRYAAAPAARPQSSSSYAPPQPPFANQPRTSSPLAHFSQSSETRPSFNGIQSSTATSGPPLRRESSNFDAGPRGNQSAPHNGTQPTRNVPLGNTERQNSYQQNVASVPPMSQYNASLSPNKRDTTNYLAHHESQEIGFRPPQRSQTQSPGKFMGSSRMDMSAGDPYIRPVSVHGPGSPTQPSSAFTPLSPIAAAKTGQFGFSQNFNYVTPVDGREHDPLQRWRGGPIFTWGVGGTVVTSFPKEAPRYGMGNTAPMMLVSPGEVKIKNLKDIYPLEQRLATFPGPLKGKSKKKDVILWLSKGIELLEQENLQLHTEIHLTHDDKRKGERVLLWKTLLVMVENDGVLEGNANVHKAVRAVLSPELDSETSNADAPYTIGANLSGIHRAAGSIARADAVDPAAVDELRKHLLRGEREKAVWEAVDKRLWAHAMLISNTVSKELYRQVAQEFVQKEVKSIGENTESLAALYEIFAGNFEESVDELVAPSARAGFQMVSASGLNGPAKDATDGLDRWRETLGLILSNRSPDDSQAILALGKLLSGYGRAEAAHICFLFARSHAIFGGSDDQNSNVVLVGSDHLRQPSEFDKELEPILLSEVYEYALSTSSLSSISSAVPHLAAYKLRHALMLAESGQRDKALQYCESIATTITSQTRRSPYHHALLVASLDDLSKRLKQSPRDESSSWISKPSIDKVSSSVWTKFNKFVAGDETDASAAAAGGAGSEAGPFARVASGTPTISRSPSNGDIYGGYSANTSYNGAIPIPTASSRTASRYAPGASSASNEPSFGSSYGSQPATAYPGSGFNDHQPYGMPPQLSNLASKSGLASQQRPAAVGGFPYAPSSYTPSHPSTPDMQPNNVDSLQTSPQSIRSTRPGPSVNGRSSPALSYQPQVPEYQNSEGGSFMQSEYQPQDASTVQPVSNFGGYEPPEAIEGYRPPESSGGYQPPEDGGYVPYVPEPDSPTESKPKKKSFMDDDEDDIPALKPAGKSKAEKDREADEAFKRAAEEDAKRATESPAKKAGWGLGGWFGKKETMTDTGKSAPTKAIRAKLGEESSFYYDPDMKKWVNKKGGKEEAAKGATPPPPKAGPPRSVSGNGPPSHVPTPPLASSGPPSGPPSRQVSGSNMPPMSGGTPPPIGDASELGGLAPPVMKRTVSNGSAAGGPPSRPTTSMSNASSIDDLLGPPQARKSGATKGKKKGRGYIDVMGAAK